MSRQEAEQVESGGEVMKPLDFWALRNDVTNLPNRMLMLREVQRVNWDRALFVPTEQLRNLGLRIELGSARLAIWGKQGITHVQLLPPTSGSWSWKNVHPEDWTNRVDLMMLS